MSRELKFRSWDSEAKKFLFYSLNNAVISVNNNDDIESLDKNRSADEQYTGLKDANSVEIYEGDIVKWDDGTEGKYWRIATVKWDKRGQWCFSVKAGTSINCFRHESHDFGMGRFAYSPDINSFGNELFVIGNIHQNPELLEVQGA